MALKSRRRFIQDSMLASAGAWTVGSWADESFAQEPQPQTRQEGPNGILNVAVVGVNGRGGSHVSQFQGKSQTRVSHICDIDERKGNLVCDGIAERQGTRPTLVNDIRKLLEDKTIDIVSIATPNHWHALGAIWAIQAGKDVYLEKPVSHNVSEGRRIVEAAEKYKRIVQTGTQSRSNQGIIEIMDFLHQGGIGKIKIARGLCYKPRASIGPKGEYPIPAGVDYDLWIGPAPMKPLTRKQFHYDWHWQWDYGCGDLGNQGIHQMDLCRWALNRNDLCKRVFSYGGRFGYEDAGETANTQVIVYDYDDDQQIVFEVRGLKTPKYNPYIGGQNDGVGNYIQGTDGYLMINWYTSGIAYTNDGKEIRRFSGGNDRFHFENFVKAVKSRNVSDLNGKIIDGHLSSALCHLGNISLRLGEQVPATELKRHVEVVKGPENMVETLDRTLEHLKANNVDIETLKVQAGPHLQFNPATEQFISNNSANAMLTREYRKPFVVPSQGNV
jgi:predicted dehydrogenase